MKYKGCNEDRFMYNTPMNLEIQTQIEENYGTPWNPTWKLKGGREFIMSITLADALQGKNHLEKLVREYTSDLIDGRMCVEYVIDWNILTEEY